MYDIQSIEADYNKDLLRVEAWDTDTQEDVRFDVPFSDIALEFCPEGNGEVVCVPMPFMEEDKDAGPVSGVEPKEITAREFMQDILDDRKEKFMPADLRGEYGNSLYEVLPSILEKFAHTQNS